MRSIVENLLTLARADDGSLELLREPVDLADVAEPWPTAPPPWPSR